MPERLSGIDEPQGGPNASEIQEAVSFQVVMNLPGSAPSGSLFGTTEAVDIPGVPKRATTKFPNKRPECWVPTRQ